MTDKRTYRKPRNIFLVLFQFIWALIRRKPIRLDLLKCDNHGCTYIEFHHRLDGELVDKPCPSCRSNLLTQEDWDEFRKNPPAHWRVSV